MGRKLDAIVETLHAGGRLGTRAGKAAGRSIKNVSVSTYENAYPFWKAYGGATMYGLAAYIVSREIMDGIITPSAEWVTSFTGTPHYDIPGMIRDLSSEGNSIWNFGVNLGEAATNYIADNFADVSQKAVSTASAIYLYAKHKPQFPPIGLPRARTPAQKIRNVSKKAGSMAAIALTGALAFQQIKPSAVDAYKRVFGTNVIADTKPIFDAALKDAEIIDLEKELKSIKTVSQARMQLDAKYLRELGHEGITDKDLYYMARVVAMEAGSYGEPNSTARRINDMTGVVHNMYNRYLAGQNSNTMKISFDDGGPLDFYGIAMKKYRRRDGTWQSEYSPVLQERTRNHLHAGYERGNLTYNERPYMASKIKQAYAVLVTTLAQIKKDPLTDPTGGSVFFLNPRATDNNHLGDFGGFRRKSTARIESHYHTGLFDDRGNNYIMGLRAREKLKIDTNQR